MGKIRIILISLFIWCTSISIAFCNDLPKIYNFHHVDEGVYCGSWIKRESQIKSLKELGIDTIINLQAGGIFNIDGRIIKRESKWAKKYNIKFNHVPISSIRLNRKNIEKTVVLLKAEKDKGRKIYFHCRLGDHRVGLLLALYRMKYESWTLAEASKEMTSHWFHPFYYFYWKKFLSYYSDDMVKKPFRVD